MLEMTQAEYARHRRVSPQAINKLVKSGKIELTPRNLIDAAAADRALGETRERINVEDAEPSLARRLAAGGASLESGGLTKAKTATEVYKARLAQLDYDERIGRVLLSEDVTRSMQACAEVIVRDIDRLPARAEDLAAAFTQGGIAGMRAHLKELARMIRTDLANSMRILARDEVAGAPSEQDAAA